MEEVIFKRELFRMYYDRKIKKVKERYHDILLMVDDEKAKLKLFTLMNKDVIKIFKKLKKKDIISTFDIDKIDDIDVYDAEPNYKYHRYTCRVEITDNQGNVNDFLVEINI
jgi:hypothetical protein